MSFLAASVLTCLEGDGVGPHLLNHRQQAVAAGGGEVLPQADALDEVQVGVEHLLWRRTVKHAHEHRDDSLDDDGIAVGLQAHMPIDAVGLQPHAALATVNQVVGRLVLLVQGGHGIAHVNDDTVTVHPVVQTLKFLNDFVLSLVDY